MKRWSGQLFPITLLALLAALSFWLESAVDLPDARHDGKTRHDPDTIAENFTVRRLNVDGVLQYRLTAPRMVHFPDDDSALVSQPQLTYFRPDAPDILLSGTNALISSRGETVYLWDQVIARRAATADRAEMIARMPDLTVQPDAGIAFTDSPVEITQGPSFTRGVGMHLDNNAAVLVLKSQVSGLFYAPKKAPR